MGREYLGERSGVAPGGGEVREEGKNFRAVPTPATGNQQNLHIIIIIIVINTDNTVQGELRCDSMDYTYNSVLTIQVVSTGVPTSASLKTGELRILGMGTLAGVHMDCGDRTGDKPSSHHNKILKFNGTSISKN